VEAGIGGEEAVCCEFLGSGDVEWFADGVLW
jgi:hypothetical protein